ncbi:alpha/beta fold hydrolase [Roseateles cellulosilyticus]|uniref:Alpha/beta hydrolase n=1 Tax=Pelomonas cellulosilytica TaxID=2906762 RepID=A0ABS8XTI0_9BURK|nr:alpha/beta hydrolase [Pelomonas sp. P8]MCE4556024.1 alpha/beta hydrolase [Pelomonas sp. P8]
MSRCIVFAHANSYPAGCYRVLFERWRGAGWRVEALDRFGHDPRFPVTSNWRQLCDQLLHFIDEDVRPDGPVALVGHSLGGMLSLMAACRRPELARSVVMLDSPVIAGVKAAFVAVAKTTGLAHRVGPAPIARQRRQTWPDREAVRQHFSAKKMFARWDPRVLDDYVQQGFEEADGQVCLRFSREIEARIYRTLPHHLPLLLRLRPPQCPVSFIGGTASVELRQAGAAASMKLAGERWRWMEGTHLFPFEKPDETAGMVLDLLG